MKRIILTDEYIKSLPITTNRIDVTWDRKSFFEKYSIVSYYSADSKYKNLAYEQLSDIPVISVTGIRHRWDENRFPYVKFFVLTKIEDRDNVLHGIRDYDEIKSVIDVLDEYDQKVQSRIIASLAINSLGKAKKGNMMYNDGSLLVCDDINFNAPKSRKELVCLKIEVNEYMILTAKTTSFSHPFNEKELGKYHNCVFQISKDVDGNFWSGQSVKPVVIKSVTIQKYDLKKLYIKKKNFKDNKNTVAYWPYDKENYSHSRLFVMWQVVNSVNEKYKELVNINFSDSQVLHYDECKTGDNVLTLVRKYLSGKTISFVNPFKDAGSQKIISDFKLQADTIMSGEIKFTESSASDIIVRLCATKEDETEETKYFKSLDRLCTNSQVLQHITYYQNQKLDKMDETKVRRILIDLLVKETLKAGVMPGELSAMAPDWQFFRYKINHGSVHGASLKVEGNKICMNQYGLSQDSIDEDFENFVSYNLHYQDYDKIRGSRDYMAMVKDGNTYLIINTDEIPILDVELIDDGYKRILNREVPLGFFKRKGIVHEYLRGYIGFHLWKTEGINGEENGSYSYISGIFRGTPKITSKTKMDKMPHARRIFILNSKYPERVESDIMEISKMLKFGFGRWDQLMTYPFPFKFLYEYLDDLAETAYSIHWNDITYNKDL